MKARTKQYQRLHAEAHTARAVAWNQAHPEKSRSAIRNAYLKKNFGISKSQYEAMLQDQNGVCAICERPERVPKRQLAVDHDHVSGLNRGLLCFECNTGLGKFNDNPLLLDRALSYLRGLSLSNNSR